MDAKINDLSILADPWQISRALHQQGQFHYKCKLQPSELHGYSVVAPLEKLPTVNNLRHMMLRTLMKSEHGCQGFMQFGVQMLLKERYKAVKAASDAHGKWYLERSPNTSETSATSAREAIRVSKICD